MNKNLHITKNVSINSNIYIENLKLLNNFNFLVASRTLNSYCATYLVTHKYSTQSLFCASCSFVIEMWDIIQNDSSDYIVINIINIMLI